MRGFFLEDYSRHEIPPYKHPRSLVKIATINRCKRIAEIAALVLFWLVMLGACGFAFVLFTLPAIPLMVR